MQPGDGGSAGAGGRADVEALVNLERLERLAARVLQVELCEAPVRRGESREEARAELSSRLDEAAQGEPAER